MSSPAEISSAPIVAEDRPTIERILDATRPMIQADGGELQLVEIRDHAVVVRLGGKCSGCQQVGETLGSIRRMLMHALGKAVRVIPARED